VSSVNEVSTSTETKIFPNPSSEKFSVQFESSKENFTRFNLYDVSGKLVRTLLEDNLKAGTNIFSFSTEYLSDGTYFLDISDRNKSLRTEKIAIHR
jgi:hypothetical protein